MKDLFVRSGRCICVKPNTWPICEGCGTDPGLGYSDLPLGVPFGHCRNFFMPLPSTCCEENEEINFDFGNGYNWLVSAWPYITDKGGPPVMAVVPGAGAVHFTVSGDAYVCGDGASGYSLVHANNVFVLTTPQGELYEFWGFERGTANKGRFKKYEGQGQTVTVIGYTGFGHIQGLQRQYSDGGDTITERIEYVYETHEDGAERATSASYSRKVNNGSFEPLERALYTYYGGSSSSSSSSGSEEEHGTTGDLKRPCVSCTEAG